MDKACDVDVDGLRSRDVDGLRSPDVGRLWLPCLLLSLLPCVVARLPCLYRDCLPPLERSLFIMC